MMETLGKKLCQARLARGLSIEEAAHETRVRPDKLIALENDDYSRFGSNAYAKGFLQIYGRFLDIDVSNQCSLLETPRQVTISDYQYLNNAPQPEPTRISVGRQDQRPSVLPVLVFGTLVVAVAAGFWINATARRLKLDEPARPAAGRPGTEEVQQQQPGAEVAQPAAPQTAAPIQSVALENAVPPLSLKAGESQPGVSAFAPAGDSLIQVRRAEPAPLAATDPAQAAAQPAVVTLPAGVNELVVEPLRKTWVKIRRDSPTAPPAFEDFLYPGKPPLKLRGSRFYVEVRDQDAVQIRKNGHPIAYQAPGISIQ